VLSTLFLYFCYQTNKYIEIIAGRSLFIDLGYFAILSWTIVIFYSFYVGDTLFKKNLYPNRQILKKIIKNKFILLSIFLYLVIHYLQDKYSIHNQWGKESTTAAVSGIIWGGVKFPGIFFIAHIITLGPIIVFFILRWNSIVQTIFEFGWGLRIFFILTFFLFLDSESRHLVFQFPFIVTLTVKDIDQFSLKYSNVILFFIISFWLSKVWLKMNKITTYSFQEFTYTHGFQQIVYNHLGPWVTPNVYFFNLGLSVLIGWIILKEVQELSRSDIFFEND
jgi:hypothetical protein